MNRKPTRRCDESGATLIEVLISTVVLGVGLMGAAQTMGTAVSSVLISQEQLIAKQKAREALESVFTARNTQNVVWNDVRNTSAGGIFLSGFQDLRETGTDGIANTADDAAAALAAITLPGPDGNLGTGDDVVRVLDSFERRIAVSDVLLPNDEVDPDIRKVEVEVRYQFRGLSRTVRLSTLISRFS
jgi:type II secretory pathway pseudopilin PulG